ncbi:MAG: hypothetical protein IPJ19_18860 [Planctomycetes bacterium]|nr:hypothetical protein [Planctomycetota bacterium]
MKSTLVILALAALALLGFKLFGGAGTGAGGVAIAAEATAPARSGPLVIAIRETGYLRGQGLGQPAPSSQGGAEITTSSRKANRSRRVAAGRVRQDGAADAVRRQDQLKLRQFRTELLRRGNVARSSSDSAASRSRRRSSHLEVARAW